MRMLLLAAALSLASCRGEAPEAPTAREADHLNEAENMLDDLGANEKGPEDRSPGPSNSSD